MPGGGGGPRVVAAPLLGVPGFLTNGGVVESAAGVLLRPDRGATCFQLGLSDLVNPIPATGLVIGITAARENQLITLNVLNDTGGAIVLVPPNPVLLFGSVDGSAGIWAMDGDIRTSSTFPLTVPPTNWAFAWVGLGLGVWCELSRSSIAFPPP